MNSAELVTAFVTLFVVIDPIGLTPLFVAMTRGNSPTLRRSIAMRACFVALIVLTVFALSGEAVLGFVGISMPAFRIAGGILLFITAFDMLFDRRTKQREDQAHTDDGETADPSVFPLGIPLIAGPGSIATIILLTGEAQGEWSLIVGYILMMLAVLLLVLLLFLSAGVLERILGPTGINVVTRLFGMLLASLAVQFVLDGIRSFWPAID